MKKVKGKRKALLHGEKTKKNYAPPFEADEYVIGSEGGSPTYYHVVQEGWSRGGLNVMGDMDSLYSLEVDPDDVKPEDWDDEEDGEWVQAEEASYDLEGRDAEGDVIFRGTLGVNELSDYFDDKVVEAILSHNGRKVFGDTFVVEDIPYMYDTPSKDNPEAVFDYLKKISNKNGESLYILPDGEAVGSWDHAGMADSAGLTMAELLDLGVIRYGSGGSFFELSKCPTRAQQSTLIGLLARTSQDVYVDFAQPGANANRPRVVLSSRFDFDTNPRRIVNDVVRYFDEGIKPLNSTVNESKKPKDVDLSSFKKKKSLPERIWKDGELNSRLRLRLMDIADDFWKNVGVDWVEPIDYCMMGSTCNYNWSNKSDIDLHIIVDFSKVDDDKDFVKEYFDTKKNDWNAKHNRLTMYGFPVELYVQDIDEKNASGGIYSLFKNKWIKTPDKDDIEPIGPEKYRIKELSSELMNKIDRWWDKVHETKDLHKVEDISDRLSALLKKLSDVRSKSLKKDGEMAVWNIVYKTLRRGGYLQKARELQYYAYDKVNSITESVLHKVCVTLNEEVVADGSAQHNPYKKRWEQEREDLKKYIIAYGTLMTSRENGKQYVVLFQPETSRMIGNNYGLCVQYDPLKQEYKSIVYIRAMDKFTTEIFQAQFDTSGRDNISGTMDDVGNVSNQMTY